MSKEYSTPFFKTDAFGYGVPGFKTVLSWGDPDSGNEPLEAEVMVHYRRISGYAGDRIDPPEPATVEIYSLERISGSDDFCAGEFFYDADLIAECLEHAAGEDAAAEEYRAEQRADDLMREKW